MLLNIKTQTRSIAVCISQTEVRASAGKYDRVGWDARQRCEKPDDARQRCEKPDDEA
jgi:hypothetical protein